MPKRCSKCNIEKEENQFYKHSGTKDGLYPSCKTCHLATCHKYLSNNPEIAKNWRDKNNEHRRIQRQNHYQKNKQKCNDQHKKWVANHKDEYRIQLKNRLGYAIEQLRGLGLANPSRQQAEQKLIQLQLKRLINEKQREINAQRNHGSSNIHDPRTNGQ